MADSPKRAEFLSASKQELLRRLLEPAGQASPIQRRSTETPVAASFAQERVFFLEELQPGQAIYNAPSSLELEGPLDTGALERALGEIVRRHEALRTTFGVVDGRPVQQIAAEGTGALELVDLSSCRSDELERRARELWEAEARRPFDLGRGPLLRTTLLRLGAERHLLLVNMHHIVVDAWSLGVFHRELEALYAAFSSGRASPLAELPIQYADFAEWQRARHARGVFDPDLAYWTQQLEGSPPLLQLPTDRARPAVQTFPGDTRWLTLPAELSQALRLLSNQTHCTLFMTLLSAFAVLLRRYSGSGDLVIGTPIANRSRTELEGLIGFFDNTLALRVDAGGNPSFRQLCARVRELCLTAYEHAELPFEKLVEALNPERTLAHAPVFQVAFSLENVPFQRPRLAGLKTTFAWRYTHTSKFELHLGWQDQDGELRAGLEYNTDLFDGATIARLLDHYRQLLTSIVAAPDAHIEELELSSSEERHKTVVEWNRTEVASSAYATAHAWFEAQADQTPDAVAIECDGQRLTYRELDRRANRLAATLRELGAGPEVRVGLCVERSLEMALGVLGTLKAGGAYVPLDPSHPSERLRLVLADSKPLVVLTQAGLRPRLPAGAARVIELDAATLGEAERSPGRGVTEEDLAYVIYTSGSTGRPKGVEMPHRGLRNLLEWHRANHLRGARVLQLAPLSFDVSFLEMFAAWASGGTLFVLSDAGRRDMHLLAEFLRAKRIEKLITPVPVLRQLAEQLAGGTELPTSLREVLAMGEALTVTRAVRRLFSRLEGCRLHNQYGPSETHVVTAYELGPDSESWSAAPPIGRPIANTQIYVLDRHLRPVPLGVCGEIFVGGASLGRGYLAEPGATAEKFVPDPFAPTPGARLYRTGDLARHLPDGNLEFLGRADDQLKIRGFRVEPAEVEAALRSHPRVRAAAAVGREWHGERRLIAYLSTDSTCVPSASELRSHLEARLPEYMVPSSFVFLDELPLSPSGKLDRRALPAPTPARPAAELPTAEPRQGTEAALAEIWRRLLGVDSVSTHDDFFALGGHSILAMQLVESVREKLGVKLPVVGVFRAPTLGALGAVIEELRGQATEGGAWAQPIPRRPDRSRHPLSKNQRYTDLDHPLDVLSFQLIAELDVPLLERCFGEIVEKHEILRARFALAGTEVVQTIAEHQPISIPVEDLRGLSEPERVARLRELDGEARRELDLASGPPFRVRLLRLGEREHLLELAIHHLVFDGVSGSIFLRLLSELYVARRRGEERTLAEPPFQYADFAAWQEAFYRSAEGVEQLAYWRDKLAGARELRLSSIEDRVPMESPNVVFAWQLSSGTFQAVRRLCVEEQTAVSTTMIAGFFALIARTRGFGDITLNTTYSGRYRPGTENLLGYFAQPWMLRVNLADRPSFRELLRRVKAIVLEAQAHGDVTPVELLDNHRIRFNYLPLVPVTGSPELSAKLAVSMQETKPHEADLHCEVTEQPDGIMALLRYKQALFSAEEIAHLMQEYEQVLTSATRAPDERISLGS